jgi:hypothetical protein
MQKLLYISLAALIFLAACSGKKEIPKAPASVEDVQKIISGKTFKVVRSGTLYAGFSGQEAPVYTWTDEMEKADDRFKDTWETLNKFQISFKNATDAEVSAEGESKDQKYRLTTETAADEKAGVKLKLTFTGPDWFDKTKTMEMTKTYHVLGASENSLLLEFPQSINDQPLVVILEEVK